MYNKLQEIYFLNFKDEHHTGPYYINRLKQEFSIFYLFTLYIKYLCDKKKYSYFKILKDKDDSILCEFEKFHNKKFNEYYHRGYFDALLSLIKYEDLNTLLDEFININYDSNLEIFNYLKGKKIIYLRLYGFISRNYFDDYFKKDNIDYLTSVELENSSFYPYYILLDKMRNIKKEYLNTIEKHKYDYLFINDTTPNYRFHNYSDSMFTYIKNVCEEKNKVILKTSYENANKIKNRNLIQNYLSNIIINNDKDKCIYLVFEDKDCKASIVLEDDLKTIATYLEEGIPNHKSVLQVKKEDIILNKYRIGYNVYKKDQTIIKKINDIVDENKKIMDDLDNINNKIREEMDKLNDLI